MEMKLLGFESRDIYVAVEFKFSEMQNIARFLERAIPLFKHVATEEYQELIQEIIGFEEQIVGAIQHVEKEKEHGS